MRNVLLSLCLAVTATAAHSAPPTAPDAWRQRVAASIPLLGHRNWILIVDSAYPLQTSPGVETIETNVTQLKALQYVLAAISHSVHVRPIISMDSELPFVLDEEAPGASAYRTQIAELLHDYPIDSVPHDKLIATVADAGSQFHILVLKTNMTIPYTSVFIRLDCKYWSADAEKRLRARMAATGAQPVR